MNLAWKEGPPHALPGRGPIPVLGPTQGSGNPKWDGGHAVTPTPAPKGGSSWRSVSTDAT